MDRDLEKLWPALEPPPGFAERVLKLTLAEPSPGEPVSLQPARPPRARAKAACGAALALALVALLASLFVGLQSHRHDHGEVLAAEPREIRIGERVTALLSSGAHVAWNGSTVQGVTVQQDRGDVEYRVAPGGPFSVQTPFGSVQVLGTIFRVHVAATPAEEPSMKTSKRTIAAASLTAGALLFVAVREGTVRLSQNDQQLTLGPGEAGMIGADGEPVRVPPASAMPGAPAPVAEPPTPLREPEGQRRAFDRLRADGVRQRAAGRSAARHQAAAAPVNAETAPTTATTPEEEERRRQYIRTAVHEQYFPVAQSCYGELLGRQPNAAGKVVMSFTIVGDGDAGVVDHVEFGDGTTMNDPEFTTCMRESMYSTVFEPPPPGTEETSVVYPITLDPGEPEDVARREHPGRVEQKSQ